MVESVAYDAVAAAVAGTGMVARGGFATDAGDLIPGAPADPVRTVVIIGNVGRDMWSHFRSGERPGAHPLDTWTRSVLVPIAESFGAGFVHPSDEPYLPFQRWAQRADDVWPSPIGLLVHPDHGLWHAYRGAFLFPMEVTGLPDVGRRTSPCLTCVGRPCLTTCPVDALAPGRYDTVACTAHIASGDEPRCLVRGCAARLACPVGTASRYGPDQMAFHMRAFVGERG